MSAVTTLTRPSEWESVYNPYLIYNFYLSYTAGIFDILVTTGKVTVLLSPMGIFKVNDIFTFTHSANQYSVRITKEATLTGGAEGVFIYGTLANATYTNKTIEATTFEPLELVLKAGHLSTDLTLTEIARFKAIARKEALNPLSFPFINKYTVDVNGYLQDFFRNIQPPPITAALVGSTGNRIDDKPLYCQYQLYYVYAGIEQPLGGCYNSIYSCVENINASGYVTALNALRVGNVDGFPVYRSMYSQLVGSRLNTSTI
jgi:hypothetical protein